MTDCGTLYIFLERHEASRFLLDKIYMHTHTCVYVYIYIYNAYTDRSVCCAEPKPCLTPSTSWNSYPAGHQKECRKTAADHLKPNFTFKALAEVQAVSDRFRLVCLGRHPVQAKASGLGLRPKHIQGFSRERETWGLESTKLRL